MHFDVWTLIPFHGNQRHISATHVAILKSSENKNTNSYNGSKITPQL